MRLYNTAIFDNHKIKVPSVKYTSFLVLLCCIFSINIFSSEKSNVQQIATNNSQNGKESALDWKAKLQPHVPTYLEGLEKRHELEVKWYEEKITSMQLQLEQKDLIISQLKSNK